MVEIKTLGGGLNQDDNLYRVPVNDYIDAINISHDTVEGANEQVIGTVVSNRVGDGTYTYPPGINETLGSIANILRNTIIDLNWNSSGFHFIREFNKDTRVYTNILRNNTDTSGIDILGFIEGEKINNINILNRNDGDLLFFLDSLGRPTEIDIDRFKSGEYLPITRSIIDKARKPPLAPPLAIFGNDAARRSNGFRNKLMRFKSRFIYKNFEKSTWGPISKTPLPVSILSDSYTNVITNNNVIQIVANTGDKMVKSIELAMSYADGTNNWSDFQSIVVIEKGTLKLQQKTDTQIGITGFDASFSTFSGIPVEGEIVNVYLTQLPSTQLLVGTYTVLLDDTLNDVANGVLSSMISLGTVLGPFVYLNTVAYGHSKTLYKFSKISITPSPISSIDGSAFPYSFYNDGVYPNIDIEESVQLYDNVPDLANAQEMPNGNILAYAGITEGYDNNTLKDCDVTVGTIAASGSGGGSSFNSVRSLANYVIVEQNIKFALSGIPAAGTLIEIKVKRSIDNAIIVATSYTTVAGDTVYTIEAALKANLTAPFIQISYGFANVFALITMGPYVVTDGSFYGFMSITPPSTSTVTNSISTWAWSTQRSIGRQYFDKHGKTNGVIYNDQVTFPAYAENGSQEPLLPYINYKINDVPPIWAYSMTFVITKEETNYLVWQTLLVNKDETAYIYLNITSIITNATKKPTTATVLSYSFKEGDRLRIWRDNDTPGILFNDTYDCAIEGLVVDPKINANPTPTVGTFLKIRNVEPFTTGLNVAKNYTIFIYTPVQQSPTSKNQSWFEFGEQYFIIDPTLSTRRHSGLVTDQIIGEIPAEYNFYEGDAYFRKRTINISEVGYSTFSVIDRNFVDFYISAVNSLEGRPSIIDIDARRAYYSTLIRFGQAYQANTNINGLNRFYSKNFDEYDYSYGDVGRLYVMDRFMRVFQRDKIGMVPLYSSIGKDGNGLQVVFNTDKLLNPIQYYQGNLGIGSKESWGSLAASNYANYGTDNIRGAVWRVSNDGVKIISILYKMNSWAISNLPLMVGMNRIYGAFDQRLNNYIVSLSDVIATCKPVYVPSISLPNGGLDRPYSYNVLIYGSTTFTLSNIVKPAWMTITVTGNTISFTGTPNIEVVNAAVSFNIANACGTQSITGLTLNITDMVAGDIILHAGSPGTITSEWLLCNGAAVSRITEAAIFAVTGTLWGAGNGTTTFNLPNMSKKIVAGLDVATVGYNTVGASGGANSLTLTDQHIAHKHTYDKYRPGGGGLDGDNGPNDFGYDTADTSSIGNPLTARTAIDLRNEFIVLPYKIRR